MSPRTGAIVSAVPGRIRLRHPTLRQASHHRDVAERLAAIDGLRVAEGNPAVGSLLVLYDPAVLAPAEAEARVAAAAALEPVAAPGTAPAPPATPMAWRINRAVKIGMLGSMAATLAGLTAGRRLHAGAGALFVALMLVHIVNHRRRLFQ